jgi:hypothetical protein
VGRQGSQTNDLQHNNKNDYDQDKQRRKLQSAIELQITFYPNAINHTCNLLDGKKIYLIVFTATFSFSFFTTCPSRAAQAVEAQALRRSPAHVPRAYDESSRQRKALAYQNSQEATKEAPTSWWRSFRPLRRRGGEVSVHCAVSRVFCSCLTHPGGLVFVFIIGANLIEW